MQPVPREAEALPQAARYAPSAHQAAPDLGAATADALLPQVGEGFVLAFLLAAMRPDALRWLGRERLSRLAAPLGLRAPKLASLLDIAPPVPALSEGGGWSGIRVPLRGRVGEISWMELSWRPDRRPGRPRDQGAFAMRLLLPPHGWIEIRGRFEESRLDAVMEVQNALPQPLAAEIPEAFGRALRRLGLEGAVTLRNGARPLRT
jgi:hypothetical protein